MNHEFIQKPKVWLDAVLKGNIRYAEPLKFPACDVCEFVVYYKP